MDFHKSPQPIADLGLTCLHESAQPDADIVFVHGIQGHPYWTWASKSVRSPSRLSFRTRLGWRRSKDFSDPYEKSLAESAARTPTPDGGVTYWPRDLLPLECPNTRILTWGYDSNVSRFFGGAADKGNIFDHAKNLLYTLHRERRACPDRPIIFIAHSLGGIIVKETLRRSDSDEDLELQKLVNRTRAILFLGTPHRGSSCASHGETMRRIVSAVGFDTNDSNLRALHFDSIALQLSQEEFIKIWRKKDLLMRTFQESSRLAGVKGLTDKIVPDISSSFGDTRERPQHLPGNHMAMCRFDSRQCTGYGQVCGEISEILGKLQPEQAESVSGSLADIYASKRNKTNQVIVQTKCQQVLESLVYPQIYDRRRMIGAPCHGTGNWLLQSSEYLAWLRGDHRFLWLKGKAGAGKSTLMKRTLEDLESQFSSESTTVTAFFYDKSGTEMEKSTLGVLQTVLYGIFTQNPDLLEQFVKASDDGRLIKGKNMKWRVEELKEVIRILTKLSRWRPTMILLDALDEGSRDDLRPLLFFFEQLCPFEGGTPGEKLRICLSSRHYPNITIKDCPEVWAESHNQSDIKEFTVQKLSHITNTFENRRLVESILNQADGVFLWVDLVTNAMLTDDDDGETLSKKMETLQKCPNGLDDLYTQILNKLTDKERTETFQIFKWTLYTSRRLSPIELCFALQFEWCKRHTTLASWRQSELFIDQGVQMEKFIRSRSRGLLEIRSVVNQSTPHDLPESSEVVHFIHQTVPEFLVRIGFAILQPSLDLSHLAGICHHQLALTCIKYLSKPEILLCASMTRLRYSANVDSSKFLPWIDPPVTKDAAVEASDLMDAVYTSIKGAPWTACQLRPPSSPHHHPTPYTVTTGFLTKVVFFELPLLEYSVAMLHGHLRRAEDAFIFQSAILDVFVMRGVQWLRLWYGFQDALQLPRKHHFHRVDWADFLQGSVALEIGSCIHEVRSRIAKGTLQLPSSCNLQAALFLAISMGLHHIAGDLIACGANLNRRDPDGFSLLDDACIRADASLVDMLIRSGADVNSTNNLGISPLHHAVKAGVVDIVRILLDAGAKLESLSRAGETPLLTAATADQLAVFQYLMARGAVSEAESRNGFNASVLAALNRSPNVYAFLNPESPTIPTKIYVRGKLIQDNGSVHKLQDIISRAMTASPSPEQMMQRSPAFGVDFGKLRG